MAHFISANKIVAQHSPTKEDLLWDPSLMAGVSDEDGKTVENFHLCPSICKKSNVSGNVPIVF